MPPTKVKTPVKKPTPKAKPLGILPRGTAADGMVYPYYRVVVHADYPTHEKTESAPPLTAEDMMELLGWEEESDENKFEGDPRIVPELTGIVGKRVRLTRNTNNRFITPGWIQTLKQEHLNRRWRFNGASIVVGQFGNVQSGQHRGISLILAKLEWEKEGKDGHWHKIWPSDPPTMEGVVVYGVKEDDDTFKTQNREKPGTFAEIMYRSEYLKDFPKSQLKVAAKALAVALDDLWKRTGMGNTDLNPWTPRQTHGELMDLLRRHPKIVHAVKYLLEADGDGGVSRIMSLGHAAAMLYLMGVSATDPDASGYTVKSLENIEERSERNLNFKYWEKAESFWMKLSSSTPREETKEVLFARRPRGGKRDDIDYGLMFHEKAGEGGTYLERYLALSKAWEVYRDGHKVTRKDVNVTSSDYYVYEFNDDTEDDTYNHVTAVYLSPESEQANVGGIDFGEAGGKEKKTKAKAAKVAGDPTATEEVEDEELADEVVGEDAGEEGDDTDGTYSLSEDDAGGDEIGEDEAEERAAIEKRMELERKKKDAKNTETAAGWLAKYEKLYPGKIIFWPANGEVVVWGKNADTVAKVLGLEVSKHDSGLTQVSFPKKDIDAALRKLINAKHKVMIAEEVRTGGGDDDYETVVRDAPAPKPLASANGPTFKADPNKKVLPAKEEVKPTKVVKPAKATGVEEEPRAKPKPTAKPVKKPAPKPAKAKK